MDRKKNCWRAGVAVLMLCVGTAWSDGEKDKDRLKEPTDPVERLQLKCDIRRVGVERLVKVFINEGDSQSATDVLRLLDIQNRVTMTRKFTEADGEVVLAVLKNKIDDMVRCRALATIGRPLALKLLTAKHRERFNVVVAEHLTHTAPMVRKTALQIITGFGNPKDYPAVVKLLEDKDTVVQSTAKGAVEVFKNARLVPNP